MKTKGRIIKTEAFVLYYPYTKSPELRTLLSGDVLVYKTKEQADKHRKMKGSEFLAVAPCTINYQIPVRPRKNKVATFEGFNSL